MATCAQNDFKVPLNKKPLLQGIDGDQERTNQISPRRKGAVRKVKGAVNENEMGKNKSRTKGPAVRHWGEVLRLAYGVREGINLCDRGNRRQNFVRAYRILGGITPQTNGSKPDILLKSPRRPVKRSRAASRTKNKKGPTSGDPWTRAPFSIARMSANNTADVRGKNQGPGSQKSGRQTPSHRASGVYGKCGESKK